MLDAWQTRCRQGAYTPELLSAFANRTGDGVLLFGLNEKTDIDLAILRHHGERGLIR